MIVVLFSASHLSTSTTAALHYYTALQIVKDE